MYLLYLKWYNQLARRAGTGVNNYLGNMLRRIPIFLLEFACVLVALGWGTSYPAARYLPSQPTHGGWRVRSTGGRLEVYRFEAPQTGLLPLIDSQRTWPPTPWTGTSVQHPFALGAVVVERGSSWTASSTTAHTALHVRYALLAIVLGSLLLVQWFRSWHHRRQNALSRGLCSVCGYDLRATPERCPECGTEILKPAENVSHSG